MYLKKKFFRIPLREQISVQGEFFLKNCSEPRVSKSRKRSPWAIVAVVSTKMYYFRTCGTFESNIELSIFWVFEKIIKNVPLDEKVCNFPHR